MEPFPPEVASKLKFYVYLLLEPGPGGRIFYVGKGNGNRAFEHLDDPAETEKARVLQRIAESGKEPVVEILRYGLTDDQARLVEAAAIDLLGLKCLTNRVRGYHGGSWAGSPPGR